MVKTLALFMDSSTMTFWVGLFADGKTLTIEGVPSHKNMTDFAVAKVGEVLAANGFKPNDLTDVYVTLGPGSFTGVRIALSIAKTLAFACPKISVHGIDGLSFQLAGRDGIAFIDARSNSWYAAVAKNGAKVLFDRVLTSEEAERLVAENPGLPVFCDLSEPQLYENLPRLFPLFESYPDYKKAVAVYIKPAFAAANKINIKGKK